MRLSWVRFTAAVFVYLVFSVIAVMMLRPPRHKRNTNVCHFLEQAESDQYLVTISFTEEIPATLREKAHEYFGYQTRAFGSLLVLRPGTAQRVDFKGNQLRIRLPLPFIANYSGDLLCSDPSQWNTPVISLLQDVRSLAERILKLDVEVTDFDNHTNFSQMKCFGSSFETRFCDMRRVSIMHQMFVFATPADYAFPQPFLCASGRSAPFDREESRLTYEPVVVHEPVFGNSEHIPGLSYVVARFFNSHMLWHTLFDFLVPCFHTFSLIEGKNVSMHRRRVFLRDFEGNSFGEIVNSLSSKPLIGYFNDNITRTFERVIVGLAKLEDEPSAVREYDSMLSVRYNFASDTAPMLRQRVFESMGIADPVIDLQNPLVLVIERKTETRRFLNAIDIEQYMLSKCPFCIVRRVDMSELPLKEQLELVAQAVVLVGVHGSGLSHVLWMRPSDARTPTAVVELLPRGYVCRDWFASAAAVANVSYYKVMSGVIARNLTDEEKENLERCWQTPELCPTLMCHDTLRDQDVWIELGAFGGVWLEIMRKIEQARQM